MVKMKPLIKFYVQKEYIDSIEWGLVKGLSNEFHEFLNLPSVIKMIDEKNITWSKKSRNSVIYIILNKSNELGFKSEKEGLFLN